MRWNSRSDNCSRVSTQTPSTDRCFVNEYEFFPQSNPSSTLVNGPSSGHTSLSALSDATVLSVAGIVQVHVGHVEF